MSFIQGSNQLAVILKSFRKSRKLTQAQTAERTGLLPKTVSLLENNPDRSTLDSLFKLLSALDLELHITEKQKPRKSPDGGEW